MTTKTRTATAPSPDTGPRLGARLWLYTNFDCNLACDYCCAESRPKPLGGPRRMSLDVASRAAEEFAGLGGEKLLLTGGEPFLHPELDQLVEVTGRWLSEPVVVLTNAMVFARGPRLELLRRLDPTRVVLQVSLDSGTSALHDLHRGRGSFARALAGIRLARDLGLRVKVAATLDTADEAAAPGLHALLDDEGIPSADRLVRPLARSGFSDRGLVLNQQVLQPELTLTQDGAWWHPVAVADPQMQVASTPLPVVTSFAVVRAVLAARVEDPQAPLARFRCT